MSLNNSHVKHHFLLNATSIWTMLFVGVFMFAVGSTSAQGQALTSTIPPLPVPRPDLAASPSNDSAPEQELAEGLAHERHKTACPLVLNGHSDARHMPPIRDGVCEVASPVQFSQFRYDGGRIIDFSRTVTVDCMMGMALFEWVQSIDEATNNELDAYLSEIDAGRGYQCRPRNNVPGAPVSEHGFGLALDLIGVELTDGRQLLIEGGFDDTSNAQPLFMQMRDTACTMFSTVLSPLGNAAHQDHIHLDLGCHGAQCAYRICQ